MEQQQIAMLHSEPSSFYERTALHHLERQKKTSILTIKILKIFI